MINALGPDHVRFVGGAVRDSLLGRPVADIDIATILPPADVIKRAEAGGLKAIPTGLRHGTVTVIAKGKPFEVTTLRRDIKTDGRHAEVAFHDDWDADAARRDFTINAIYADADGELFDPEGGAADLAAGRVRFIGDAGARIAEDALRILRFFRFHAYYGRGALDPAGLNACRETVEKLDILSIERVRDELLKILGADDPLPVLEVMADSGVLDKILPGFQAFGVLAGLIETENKTGDKSAQRRLFTLLPTDQVKAHADRLKLSNAEKKRLIAMTDGPLTGDWRETVYRTGKQAVIDRIILYSPVTDLNALRGIIIWPVPKLPVTGEDLLASGISEGPEMGKMLHELEDIWIASGFVLTRDRLLAKIGRKS